MRPLLASRSSEQSKALGRRHNGLRNPRTMERLELTNLELAQVVIECKRHVVECVKQLSERYPSLTPSQLIKVKRFLGVNFLSRFHKLWNSPEVCRSTPKLLAKYGEWLARSNLVNLIDSEFQEEPQLVQSQNKVGRKRKPYDECAPRTKKVQSGRAQKRVSSFPPRGRCALCIDQ